MGETTVKGHTLPDLHPDAVAVTAFRGLPDGTGRFYTVAEAVSDDPKDKWLAINHLLRMARACGYAKATCGGCTCYAVLDILDSNNDLVQDFCIPTDRAFRWWYRKLHLRVEDVQAEIAKYFSEED